MSMVRREDGPRSATGIVREGLNVVCSMHSEMALPLRH